MNKNWTSKTETFEVSVPGVAGKPTRISVEYDISESKVNWEITAILVEDKDIYPELEAIDEWLGTSIMADIITEVQDRILGI